MAKTVSKKLTASSKKYLERIAKETVSSGVMYVDSRAKVLVELGYVTVDETDVDEDGDVAAKITPEGAAVVGVENEVEVEVEDVEESEETVEEFPIDDNVEIPKLQRKAYTRKSRYPFDRLEAGQSFHVAETNPEAVKPLLKKMSSNASNTNKKYRNEDGTYEKHFFARAVDERDPRGPGVRVKRDI